MTTAPIVVAIVDTNPEIARLLQVNLERAGCLALAVDIEDVKTGSANVKSLLQRHDPKVIVYDVAPPYEENWRFLDHLRQLTDFRNRHFVLTSVNVAAAQQALGREETVYEIVGRDGDIREIVRAVKEASRARPTH